MASNLTRWFPFRGVTRWTSPFDEARTFDPFGGMLSLRQAMDRLFEDAFVRPSELIAAGLGDGQGTLAVDLYETENEVVIAASVPGVKPEDVDISVQGDVLTIRGETKTESEETKGNYHLRERRYGTFFRQLQLPVPVKTERAEARFENGLLTLKLPKAEEAKERRIPVTVGQEKAKAGRGA